MKNNMIMVILRSYGKRISTEFFSKGSQKCNKTTTILQFFFVLEGKYLSWHHMSKFPGLSGFWEFPKDFFTRKVHENPTKQLIFCSFPLFWRSNNYLGTVCQNSQTLVGFGNFPKPQKLSQFMS